RPVVPQGGHDDGPFPVAVGLGHGQLDGQAGLVDEQRGGGGDLVDRPAVDGQEPVAGGDPHARRPQRRAGLRVPGVAVDDVGEAPAADSIAIRVAVPGQVGGEVAHQVGGGGPVVAAQLVGV